MFLRHLTNSRYLGAVSLNKYSSSRLESMISTRNTRMVSNVTGGSIDLPLQFMISVLSLPKLMKRKMVQNTYQIFQTRAQTLEGITVFGIHLTFTTLMELITIQREIPLTVSFTLGSREIKVQSSIFQRSSHSTATSALGNQFNLKPMDRTP